MLKPASFTLRAFLTVLLLSSPGRAAGDACERPQWRDKEKTAEAAGDKKTALALYQEAHKLCSTPRLLWPIANLLLDLDQPREGLEALHQYRTGMSEDDPARQSPAEIAELERKLRARVARLVITADGLSAPGAGGRPEDRHESGPRPRWRLAVGATTLVVGVALAAPGIWALAVNGHCHDQPVPPALTCEQVYDTTALGGSLLSTGIALSATGIVLLALPASRHPVRISTVLWGSGLGLAASY